MKKNIFVLVAACLIAVMPLVSCQQDVIGADQGTALELSAAQRSVAGADIVGININTAAQLALIGVSGAFPLNGSYDLTTDLTLNNWTPIPTNASGPFMGTFDGHGHTITVNSFNTTAATNNIGIFAVIGDGDTSRYPPVSVSNLTVNIAAEQINPVAAQNVGGLVGETNLAVFTGITVTGALDVIEKVPDAGSVLNVGGVAGHATSSSFIKIRADETVTATFEVPSSSPLEFWKGTDTFRVRSTLAAAGSDGLAVGGVVGSSDNTQFNANISSSPVTGQSQTIPVYAGGVLGSSNGATVVSSTSSGAINSIGFGYNTSAGGIGGYIVASRVLDSSASGSVSATASSRTFGWDDSWQVYSGGLIGYAGGSDTAPSSIEHSNATSTVNATSPFPYAGGLVGYLYGYNDFSNPAKNGSTVTRSFATGDVTAISSTDPSGTYGDIPYAGGLVGYSSVVGCRIENSYARGNATVTTNGTYAWAGGLIGGNANDAVVSKTYATGTVSSTTGTLPPLYAPDYADAGPAAGGIAGFNYYSTATTVSDSAALNNRVNGNQTSQNVVHRVAGSTGNTSGRIGTLNNNIGSQSMAIGTNWQQDIGSNLRDGADTAAQPGEPVFTGTLRWDFLNIWVMASDNYPALR